MHILYPTIINTASSTEENIESGPENKNTYTVSDKGKGPERMSSVGPLINESKCHLV